MKISGNCSRKYALKSLNFYLRSNQYGDDELDYSLFPNRDRANYERIRLRNSGQDYRSTMMRDGINQRILAEVMDVEYQSLRPTLVYINGEYYGIQNFRELYSTEYFEELFNVEKNGLDLLKRPRVNTEVKAGDDLHYNQLYDFMAANNLRDTPNFEQVTSQFDINNFLDYWISMLYLSNADWPSNNVQIWRPRTSDGKWRYMYTDTDNTTNLYGETSPNGHIWDRIREVSDSTLIGWPNDNRATLPFRSMIKNETFREEFIQRSCTYMELVFNQDRVHGIIDAAATEIDDEIGRHVERWAFDNPFLTEYEDWAINVAKYKQFFQERPNYFYTQLADNFELETTYELSFDYDEMTNGDISLHWKKMSIPYDYTGTYYTGLPIRIHAEAKEGYIFSHWLETGDTTSVIEFIANEDAILTPIFEKEEIVDAVTDHENNRFLNIYPNPTDGILYFKISTTIPSDFSYAIYDPLGQLIQTEHLNPLESNTHKIALRSIPNGFYYLVLNTGEKIWATEKFILKR